MPIFHGLGFPGPHRALATLVTIGALAYLLVHALSIVSLKSLSRLGLRFSFFYC